MSSAERAAEVKSISKDARRLHNEKGHEKRSVTKLWEDGEITFEKGGDLYGMRHCHTIHMGLKGVNVPMPKQYNKHSFAYLTTRSAIKLRQRIFALYPEKVSKGQYTVPNPY